MSSFSLINPEAEIENLPQAEAGMAVLNCNRLHAQIEQSIVRAWQTAVVLGFHLKNAKANLPHGEFGKLFRPSNVHHGVHLDFNRQMGARYMSLYMKCLSLAKKQDKAEQLNDLLLWNSERTLEIRDALNELLPDVQSMRQALLAFESAEAPPQQFAAGEVVALEAAVGYCNSLHNQIEQSLERSWQTAVVLGYQLDRAKANLRHGEFTILFRAANGNHGFHFNFSRQTSTKYMRLYKNCLSLAKKQDTAEQLNELLQGGAEATLELGDALNELLPDVQSMRQALLAFESAEAPPKQFEAGEAGCFEAAVVYCNGLHNQIEQSLERSWQTAVVLGYQLSIAKDSLPHGEFSKLFASRGKTRTCARFEFSPSQARRYMSLYKKCLGLAKKQDATEQLNNLLQDGTAALPELADALNELLPDVQSMRQALLAFEFDNRGAAHPSQFKPEPPTAEQAAALAAGEEEVDPDNFAIQRARELGEIIRTLATFVEFRGGDLRKSDRENYAGYILELADMLKSV